MEIRVIKNRNDLWQWSVQQDGTEHRSYREYRNETAALKAGMKMLRRLQSVTQDEALKR